MRAKITFDMFTACFSNRTGRPHWPERFLGHRSAPQVTPKPQVTNENHDLKKLATTPNNSPQLKMANRHPPVDPTFSATTKTQGTLRFSHWTRRQPWVSPGGWKMNFVSWLSCYHAWRFHVGIKNSSQNSHKTHLSRCFPSKYSPENWN